MKRGAPMRRTGFKRKPLQPMERAATDLAGGEVKMRALLSVWRPPVIFASRADVAPVVQPKAQVLRSESYRRYVASFPCFDCGAPPPSQCAHANEGKGLAMKVCDSRTFPLCPGCHEALDNSRGLTREQRRETERAHVQRMQKMAREADREEAKYFAESA